ncbi:unnamed protein product, partial [Trichogramma brassicae]
MPTAAISLARKEFLKSSQFMVVNVENEDKGKRKGKGKDDDDDEEEDEMEDEDEEKGKRDVTSLFTCIPCDLVLTALDRRYEHLRQCSIPFEEIRRSTLESRTALIKTIKEVEEHSFDIISLKISAFWCKRFQRERSPCVMQAKDRRASCRRKIVAPIVVYSSCRRKIVAPIVVYSSCRRKIV